LIPGLPKSTGAAQRQKRPHQQAVILLFDSRK
jgi:hypothetical protein